MSILNKKPPSHPQVYNGGIKKKRLWVVLRALLVLSIFTYGGIVLGAQIKTDDDATQAQTAATSVSSPSIYDLWVLTNTDRQEAKESPLQLDPYLNTSAQLKCNDMIARNYFGHTTPDGTPFDKLIRQYAPGNVSVGENLSTGYNTSQDVENAWLNSPEHAANIFKVNYGKVGFAVCTSTTGATLVVEHFSTSY